MSSREVACYIEPKTIRPELLDGKERGHGEAHAEKLSRMSAPFRCCALRCLPNDGREAINIEKARP